MIKDGPPVYWYYWPLADHIMAVSTALLVVLISLAIYLKPTDPYGLFHLSLNKLPGQSPDTDPRTEWLNMGYWKDTDIFPEACEALAIKLVAAANCEVGGNVLDVGHGSGESLILQLSHPKVPRPSHLTGITSLKAHYQRSADRVTRLHASQSGLEPVPDVVLRHGDAVFRPGAKSEDHPLDPSSQSSPYTAILALDCAYHFNTRSSFLRQSFLRLTPGGRIALADICFTPAALQTNLYHNLISIRTLVRLSGLMPRSNMISTDQYVSEMQRIGYMDVQMEDLSDNVFPAFTKFLRRRGGGWWVFASILGWWAGRGMRFIVISGKKPE